MTIDNFSETKSVSIDFSIKEVKNPNSFDRFSIFHSTSSPGLMIWLGFFILKVNYSVQSNNDVSKWVIFSYSHLLSLSKISCSID